MGGSTCFLCKIRPGINPTHDVKATALLRSNDQRENKFALFEVFPLHLVHVMEFHLYVLYKRPTLPLTFVFVCGIPLRYKDKERNSGSILVIDCSVSSFYFSHKAKTQTNICYHYDTPVGLGPLRD